MQALPFQKTRLFTIMHTKLAKLSQKAPLSTPVSQKAVLPKITLEFLKMNYFLKYDAIKKLNDLLVIYLFDFYFKNALVAGRRGTHL